MQLKEQKCHTFWIHYKSTEILQAFYYFNIADYGIQLKKTQIYIYIYINIIIIIFFQLLYFFSVTILLPILEPFS